MHRFSFLLFLLMSLSAHAQLDLAGVVRDTESKEPLSYVNIGLIGKNIGTVSDRLGNFKLFVPEKNYSDPLRISIIGYESIEMEANQLEKLLQSKGHIDLKPSAYEMEEVVISSSKMSSKVVGNRKWSENISAGFGEDSLGNEMGILIKIKKRTTLIKDVTIVMGINENDTVRFRLNVYTVKNGRPHENILKKNVIIEAYKDDEIVTTDLEKYQIIVEDDFFISLEWIEDYPEESIYFSANLFGKPVWAREASQGRWSKVPLIGIGLYTTIYY